MKYKDTRVMSIMSWGCLLLTLKNFILYLHFILVFLLLNLNKNIAGLEEFFFSYEWEYFVIKMVKLIS